MIGQLMKNLVMNLVPGLSVPVSLYFFLYFISEISFRFYLLIRIKLAEEFFVQLLFFQQPNFSDYNLKVFISGCWVIF